MTAAPDLSSALEQAAALRAEARATLERADAIVEQAASAEIAALDGVRWTGDAGVSVDRLVTRMGIVETGGRRIVVRPTFDLDGDAGETAWMCVAMIGNDGRTAFGASAAQALERAAARVLAEL